MTKCEKCGCSYSDGCGCRLSITLEPSPAYAIKNRRTSRWLSINHNLTGGWYPKNDRTVFEDKGIACAFLRYLQRNANDVTLYKVKS